MRAKVKVDSGANSDAITARLYANAYSSPEFGYAPALCDTRLVASDDWQLLSCSLATAAPADFDLQRVLNYGVVLRIESDASATSSSAPTTIAHLDDFELSE